MQKQKGRIDSEVTVAPISFESRQKVNQICPPCVLVSPGRDR